MEKYTDMQYYMILKTLYTTGGTIACADCVECAEKKHWELPP